MKTSFVLQVMAFGFLIAFVLSAVAGQATIEAQDNGERASIQLEYRDGGMVRMSVPQQPEGFLLVKDKVAYSVSQQGGQAAVMRLDALRGLGRMMPAPSPTGDLAELGELVGTGRQETVAGVRGEVWSVSYVDEDGRSRQSEIVLSDDPRAVALTSAMNALSVAMASAFGQDMEDKHVLDQQFSGKGILRMGETMRVTSLSSQSPPLARFALPAEPAAMPDTGGFGDRIGELFGNKTERQQSRIEDRVEQEADDSLDRKVKGFLESVF